MTCSSFYRALHCDSAIHSCSPADNYCFWFAGIVSYSINILNSGNVQLRGLILVVPKLSGSSMTGSITCIDSATTTSWAMDGILPAGRQLTCTGSYNIDQAGIERGDMSPILEVTTENTGLGSFTQAFPVVKVPNTPSLIVDLDPTTCIKPTKAGMARVAGEPTTEPSCHFA